LGIYGGCIFWAKVFIFVTNVVQNGC